MRWVRRIGLVIAAIAVVGIAYRVLGVYELRSGECSAREARRFATTYPSRLVVMSFNIQGHAALVHGDHIAEIARTIQRHDPDVVALNEAHRWTWQARFDDHVTQLSRLTRMNAVFGRSFTFLGGHFGNAILTKGAIVSSEVHKLPGRGEPRTLLKAILAVNGGTIEVYVTHTAAWASLGRGARADQLECINEHLGASSHPFILAGDLNAPPDAPEMSSFLGRNTLRLTGEPKEATHRTLAQRLDYILVDPGWRVARAAVIDDGPSDHLPVIAELVRP